LKTVENIAECLNAHQHPIQIADLGYIELAYRPARIQQHGRLLQPPRHIWVIRKGESLKPPHLKLEDFDENWRITLQQGLLGAVSFELPGLGMCYRHEGYFELLPAKSTPRIYPADFGLNALSVKPLEGVKKEVAPVKPLAAAKSWKQSTWWLKIAAVFLALLFINLLMLQVLTEDGKLSFNQVAELNPFDSLTDRSPFTFEEEADLDTEVAAIEAKMYRIIQQADSSIEKAADSALRVKAELSTAIPANAKSMVPKDSVVKPSTPTAIEIQPNKVEPKKALTNGAVAPLISNQVKSADPVKLASGDVQIVVGAFSASENAETLKKKLQKEGWNCQISKGEGSSLHRVIVVKAAEKGGEEVVLQEVKEKINPQSWILAGQ